MPLPITEVATFHVSNLQNNDPNLFLELVKITEDTRSATGMRRQAWGTREQDPEIWQWFIDWESREQHMEALNNVGPEVKDKLPKLIRGSPSMVHVPFRPFDAFDKCLVAPVIEIIFARLKDTAETQTFSEVTETSLVTAGNAEGCLGWAWGYALEDERDAVLIVGWTSIGAHERFKQTQAFETDFRPLREAVSRLDSFHVKLQLKLEL